jgi:hypothetical protein
MDALLAVREEVMVLLEQARGAKYVPLFPFLFPSPSTNVERLLFRLIGSSTEATVVLSNPSDVVRKHGSFSPLSFSPFPA